MSQTAQMDVLYLKDLGHVLGIFTRNSEPGDIEPDASAFVGDGLHLRALQPGQDLVIPPAMIALFRTDRNSRQIFKPFDLYATHLDTTPALSSFAGTPLTVSYTSPNLIITLANVGATIQILVLDKAGGTPVQFSAAVTTTQTSVPIAMTGLVATHTYDAYIFVPGYPIKVQSFTAL